MQCACQPAIRKLRFELHLNPKTISLIQHPLALQIKPRRVRRPVKAPIAAIAVDSSSEDDEQQAMKHAVNRQQHPLLESINESTKWAVSAVAFGTLLIRRDLLSSWCILGSVIAAIVCRLLKFAINESRPLNARKKDPGMPSSHANSLSFLSSFVSLAAMADIGLQSVVGKVLVMGVPVVGLFLAWLRVALGYHTFPQVAVGWVLGTSLAMGWWHIGYGVLSNGWIYRNEKAVYVAASIAVVVFVFQNVRRWFKE